MTTTFKLHPQLRADCHLLGSFELSLVLLNRNAALPWFILVPRTDATDLLDLDVGDRELAIDESARVSAYVKSELAFPKVNFAAIGMSYRSCTCISLAANPETLAGPLQCGGTLKIRSRTKQTAA